MNTDLINVIQQCNLAIEKDHLHHLDLSYRNKIFSLLDKIQCSHLVLRTINATLPIWKDASLYDNKMETILETCEKYLQKDVSSQSFSETLKAGFAYMENRLNEEKYCAAYAGLSSVYAGLEILNNNFIKDNTNEFLNDATQWSSLFYASLSYNNGAIDSQKTDKNKNKIFWSDHFLKNIKSAVLGLPLNFHNVISDKTEKWTPVPIERTQADLALKDDEIKKLLERLSEPYKEKYLTEEISELSIVFYHILNTTTITATIINNNGETAKLNSTDLYLFSMTIDAENISKGIKEAMYILKKEEGAWFSMTMAIQKDSSVSWNFNYDKKEDYINKYVGKANLILELKKFPRNSRFTLQWLKEIE